LLYTYSESSDNDPSLDERRCQGARQKAAAFARMSKTEGKHQKAGVVRHSRHEGLAPVRLSKGSKPVRALLRANSCRTSDRSACLFPQGLGLMTRAPWTPDSLFAFIGSAAAESDKRRPSVRDHETAPALHLLEQAGGTENEDRRNDDKPEANTPILPRRLKPNRASKSKKMLRGSP
jgi:hypothetical protein